ncbi:uncharacterized protein EAF01_010572 [Botrytis porri]|uniref:uncharacterized protein n=1 Tax=Botrytis porri TaxID=87229 RepID=UPI0018FF4860|nr:uncharacterized protein EAF01_010572 [Botrytis porri]KAF7890763.1 hypothetical protein EAF01_010572 [Botrytis porri]
MAAMSGDTEIVRTSLYPPSCSTVDDANFIDRPFVPQESSARRSLLKAQMSIGNLEMYKYLEEFFPRPAQRPTESVLTRHIGLENFEIVKYILDTTGAFFSENGSAHGAKRQDIIYLLLKYGLDANFARLDEHKLEWLGDKPISKEAQARNKLLIRKFLDRGASLYRVQTANIALEWVVSREDTVMVEMLLASEIDLASCGGRILRLAVSLGLDLMEDILHAEFFNLSILQRALSNVKFNDMRSKEI